MIRSTSAGLALAVLTVLSVGGCAAQMEMMARQDAESDSLYAVNRRLESSLQALQDSLQFYDDIDTGQYYRDRRTLMQEIGRLEYELGVCGDGGRTVQTLLVDELFEPASAKLTDTGLKRLALLADTLATTFTDYRIWVEAHSDATPVGGSLAKIYPSNWELSASRAGAVVRYLIDKNALRADQVALVSFGSARPVATNSTAAGRSRNRRIRIAVMRPK